MSADFLLELRSEEIPARMQAGARNDLARLFAEELQKAGLSTGGIETFSTPRRLALIARGLPLETDPRREELKGPRTSAPEQALEGFLRKTGLSRDQLEDRDGIWFAILDTPGQGTRELLGPMVERIVRGFPWPKSMRWGAASQRSESLRWVRPLHGIVAILGEDIVPVSIDGIDSGAATLGHRFHHPGAITIGGAHDYVEKLRACHVVVDHDERERIIRDGADKAAKAAGLNFVEDEGLVVENAGLTEWPVPMLGRFDADYLDVPREVIVLTMRSNQKYFACTDGGGALAPAFVCVANIDSKDGGEAIVEGNRRVLAARLSDARFFWEQDLKVPLEEQAKKLEGIVFHEKLGTVANRCERMQAIVDSLSAFLPGLDAGQARRSAQLAKADLVSGTVGEFPEVQGIIGGYLAEAQGEPKAVAGAIAGHYGPAGPHDPVPSDPVAVALGLADRIDILVGFFGTGMKPTGSKDPFALRRAALATIRLIIDNGIRLPLADTFRAAAALYRNSGIDVADPTDELLAFFADRLKVQQREAGVRHDLIDAVFALGGEDDLVRLLARVKALQAFVETGEGGDLLTAYKRAANILKKEKWDSASAGKSGVEAEEQALIDSLDSAEPKASAAVEKEDFTSAMAALASLRAPIDSFFDKVTVNADDAAIRARRLNLLAHFRDAVDRVADFSKIEG